MAKKWPEMVLKWAIVIVIRFYSDYSRKILYFYFFTVPKRRLTLNLRKIQSKKNIVNGVWKVLIQTSIMSIPVWNILGNFLKNTSFQKTLKT